MSEVDDLPYEDDPSYCYEPDGDHWEVFAVFPDGDREWRATVETEFLAEKLVQMLRGEL